MTTPDPQSGQAVPNPRFDLAALRRDAWKTNWSMTNARSGLLCLPVIAAWVFVGVISGHHDWAVRATAGAVAVAFAAFQRFGERKLLPMAGTLVGIVLATWIGCVAGHLGWLALLSVAIVWGLAFGAMTAFGFRTWWIGLQWTIGLLVFGGRTAPPAEALWIALGVLAGGVSQLVVLGILLPMTSKWFRGPAPSLDEGEASLRAFARHANPFTLAGRYALRVSVALALAATVGHFWGIANGYWVPMTAAILLKPNLHETTVRGINRLVGTLVGAGNTTLVIALLRPDQVQLGLLLLLAIYSCFVLQRVHYALFAAAITAYVVLLLSLVGLPEPEVALHRVEATLIGAAIALLVHGISLPQRRVVRG